MEENATQTQRKIFMASNDIFGTLSRTNWFSLSSKGCSVVYMKLKDMVLVELLQFMKQWNDVTVKGLD